jgi:hypothetical protein
MRRPSAKAIACVAAIALSLLGCMRSRSISNSAYREPGSGCWGWEGGPPTSDPAFVYRGELSEYDVLGLRPGDTAVSEEVIRQTLERAEPLRLTPSSTVLVVQSGALFPDEAMLSALRPHFAVVPFSGVPAERPRVGVFEEAGYARALRLAAARAGAATILCYWGVLESGHSDQVTKTISWIPLAGRFLPDEKESMRIRLKLAVIDVASGRWSLLSPDRFDRARWSTKAGRGRADQKLVEELKQEAYAACVRELVHQHLP